MNLCNKSELMSILSAFNFSFSKSLGQNFLIDKNILDKIVGSADIDENTNVLEIGPGAGTLTRELCERAKKVVSVEIDKALIPVLNYVMSDFDNFTLINNDIMKIDIKKLTHEHFGDEKFVVAANLPYYITTPVIMSVFESGLNVKSMTLMIQKEVAARISAKCGTKDYGALTIAAQYYSEPELICSAPPHCFFPQPKVTSSVIKLKSHETPLYTAENPEKFFLIVKSVFSQRRKTMVNSLIGSPYIKCEKEDILEALRKLNINPQIRGEKLSINQMIEFSNIITAEGGNRQ